MKKILFIGLGLMGLPMAKHLIDANFNVYIYPRNKINPDSSLILLDSLNNLPKDLDYVITNVTSGKDLLEVIEKTKDYLPKNIIWLDFSTINNKEAIQASIILKEKEINFLDCPVTGGTIGAQNATLTIMVGGSKELFDKSTEIFNHLGKKHFYMGKTGSGQLSKSINQIGIATSTIILAESLTLAKKYGLNSDKILEIVNSGTGCSWASLNLGNKMITEDFLPGFHVKNMVKDLKIATSNEESNDLILIHIIKEIYENCLNSGMGESGIQAIIKNYD